VVIGSLGANQQKMDDRNRLGGKGAHGKEGEEGKGKEAYN